MITRHYKSLFLVILVMSLHLSLKSQTEYIVKVDPTTGIFNKIDSIPNVVYLQSNSTYNRTTKEYTVMGTRQPGQAPNYLYTMNALTGKILWSPLLTSFNNIISSQYSRSSGMLYGIIRQNNTYHLATVNKTTGAYTIIKELPGIDAIGLFTIDEANQRLFLRAVDNNPSFALWTIDLLTGNILNHVSCAQYIDLHYDNAMHKLYGLVGRSGTQPGTGIWSICTIDPVTGIAQNVVDIPGVTGIISGHGCFNEIDQTYYFTGVETPTPTYLYSINVITGSIINKAAIPTSGSIDKDNLIFFQFDNLKKEMYGLLWEAKTIRELPVLIDSTCRHVMETKYHLNSAHNLIIEKKATTCKVVLNIYNVTGQLIIRNKVINDGYNEIILPNLSKGIYYFNLISENKILLTRKFIN